MSEKSVQKRYAQDERQEIMPTPPSPNGISGVSSPSSDGRTGDFNKQLFKNETDFRNWLQCELSKHGYRMFRNNVGIFFTAEGVPTRTGLCKGSGDLIGLSPTGQFVSIETKSKRGTRRPEQVAWAEMVNKMGGIAIFVKPGDDFLSLLKR